MTPIRRLQGYIDGSTNTLHYVRTGDDYEDFNPAVMAASTATQLAGYLNQINSYEQAFSNMDMYMLMTREQRQAMKFKNKYAAMDSDLVFDPTMAQYENKAGWFRSYATFERVPLKHGPKVSNVSYGTYLGGDSQLYDLGNGWDGMFSLYAEISPKPLHAIQVEPGLKFIGNLKHGWQPYAGVSVIISILDRAEVHANDVSLPDLSVKPYARYGIGIRKTWGEKFTGFIQTYFTSGGRNGMGVQAGLRWALGEAGEHKINKAQTKMPEKQVPKVVLNNIQQ